MKGRTKSFFEDLIVLLLILVVAGFLYNFFFNDDETTSSKTNQIPTTPTTQNIYHSVEEKPQISIDETKNDQKTDEIVDKKKDHEENASQVDEVKQIEIKQNNDDEQMNQKNIEEKLQEEVLQKDEEVIEKPDSQEEVDLAVLREFLAELKDKIRQKLDVTEMENSENNFLSIRITILKDGSYEQLTFIGGNKIIYDNNVDNILSIFPLTIDEKIIAEFPRYIRLKFEFIQKEE